MELYWHIWNSSCEHHEDLTVLCNFIKLGIYVNYDESINPTELGDQRSNVKVIIDIYGNTGNLVKMIEIKLFTQRIFIKLCTSVELPSYVYHKEEPCF